MNWGTTAHWHNHNYDTGNGNFRQWNNNWYSWESGYFGDWVKITFPEPVVFTGFKIVMRQENNLRLRSPRRFKIYVRPFMSFFCVPCSCLAHLLRNHLNFQQNYFIYIYIYIDSTGVQ
jgi:hypothetical protein